MNRKYKTDREWADVYIPTVMDILKENASFLVTFKVAPEDKDLKEVADIVLETNMGHIGVRVRRPDVSFRDWTIRSKRKSGVETEIHKMRQGFCRWYFYGWASGPMPNGNGLFQDWILVDVDRFRSSKLAYENKKHNSNNDGTWFYAYSTLELNHHRCIIATHDNRKCYEVSVQAPELLSQREGFSVSIPVDNRNKLRYLRIERVKEGYLLYFSYDVDFIHDLKILPRHARKYDKIKKCWIINELYINCVADFILAHYDIDLTPHRNHPIMPTIELIATKEEIEANYVIDDSHRVLNRAQMRLLTTRFLGK